MEREPRRGFYLLLGMIGILIALLSCNLPTVAPDGSENGGEIENGTTDAPITIEINLGVDAVQLLEAVVGNQGGTITVIKPGDPLDGLQIEVPAGAYPQETHFEITYREITTAELGEETTANTPMIQIDNGGVYAEKYLLLTIPLQVEEDDFAMPFYYDETSGEINGILPISIEGGEVKAALRHFSDVFVITTPKAVLDRANITTSFAHGVDNWQFTNYGTYPTPGGHCSGQSLTAMLYHQRFQDSGLYGLYDNYNNTFHKTPGLDRDDRLGLRLVTTAQIKQRFGNESTDYWFNLQKNYYDDLTYYAFAQTMRTTGEPQYMDIRDDWGAAHVVIAYRKYKDRFYISDPNFPDPSENRVIVYQRNGKKFATYKSGSKAGGFETYYSKISYLDKYGMMSQGEFNQLWAQFEAGTIGDDIFPKYALIGLEKSATGDFSPTRKINSAYFQVEGDSIYLQMVPEEGFSHKVDVYFYNTTAMKVEDIGSFENEVIELPFVNSKEDIYGFVFRGEVGGEFEWIDARWIHFIKSWDTSWDSGPLCDEAYETRYRWSVSLLEGDLGNLSGTVHFHNCPMGGQAVYHVVGELLPGSDYAVLSGTKISGDGLLGENTPATQQFNIQLDKPPSPNFAP